MAKKNDKIKNKKGQCVIDNGNNKKDKSNNNNVNNKKIRIRIELRIKIKNLKFIDVQNTFMMK